MGISFIIPAAICDLNLTPAYKGILNGTTFFGEWILGVNVLRKLCDNLKCSIVGHFSRLKLKMRSKLQIKPSVSPQCDKSSHKCVL